jgi:FkbM family methyltransferase
MKYFVDLGAADGDTVCRFIDGNMIQRNDLAEFEIYAFEPLPRFCEILATKFTDNPKVHTLDIAAWTEEGEAEFTLDIDHSATLCKDNYLWSEYKKDDRIIKVKTINFSDWIYRLPDKEYVIIKVDIEGAEFDLLEKMIADGTDKMVDEFLIEFHQRMFENFNVYHERANKIENHLADKIKEWE